MNRISLAAAITLTEWSERTFYRKIADGYMSRVIENGRLMIPFELLKPHLSLALSAEDITVLQSADAGDAEAQNNLAVIFLSHDKPKGAIYWLELAAKQGCADAMSFLMDCYVNGKGVARDENAGMMWLAKAAALGHFISQRQMQGIYNKFEKQ
ncbi:MAG: sel1 repeat family protein [Methylophilaceae bacterium]|nr:sel1 repeat family protein [Methylophilaceae bacterium]